jgi:regulator of nonsense transcripts 2
MDQTMASQGVASRVDDEKARHEKRVKLKELNSTSLSGSYNPLCNFFIQKTFGKSSENAKLDSSLKRHTALIKRIRQSMATDNRDQIMKEIESLSLEKYVDELAGAVVEGLGRCKTEKDVWSAVEVLLWLPFSRRQ